MGASTRIERVVEELNMQSDDRILEIGCGQGVGCPDPPFPPSTELCSHVAERWIGPGF